jgi:tRNA nucleotidyltransferase (CCA-adding enzyme)
MMREDVEIKIQRICKEALRRASPTEREREETLSFAKRIAKRLEDRLKADGFKAEVQIEGSVAKDTWLAGEKDIDLFILIPKDNGREAFLKILEIAKKNVGGNYLEAYAEHPYIQVKMEGFTVEFVPCFKLERVEDAASSVDRTPFHTAYVKRRLNPKIRDEVLLLKRFMHGIGTYGAEIKVGGFSGYLCELLILRYGSFLNLLKASSNWRRREIIDLEGFYRGFEDEARKIFPEPFIVVDPVDKGRNVASAVRINKLSEFIAASREFLKNPSLEFFYPPETPAYSVNELFEALSLRGTTLIFLKTGVVKAVPDVLWGQLYRSQKALGSLIRQHGFTVISDGVWSDEESVSVFLFELYSRFLPAIEKHIGPPINKKEDCERFLAKYSEPSMRISGPRIEGDRWVVERKRRYNDVVAFLRDKLRDNMEKIGIGKLVSQALSSSFQIWVNHEVEDFYLNNPQFALYLTEYLKGKPKWLK